MRHKTRRRTPGFTLIELLVIVAIIAVLVSILAPSLRKVRDTAREVACLSNMRQIYTGIAAYGNDYERYLPDAWHIMERQWVGWHYARFLHNKMGALGYMDADSDIWLDPGWPADQPYQSNLQVVGTKDDPGAGMVPGTPRNFGEGYYYTAWFWVYFWNNPETGYEEHETHARKVRFGKPKDASRAKIMSCLPDQQVPWLGRVGPHRNHASWNILWLDGSTTRSGGYWGVPSTFDLYCNYPGDWNP